MGSQIENYSLDELKKEIKHSGWIVTIFALVLVYLTIEIVTDLVQGYDLPTTLIFAYIAMAAGISPTYLKRRKMKTELQRREGE